MRHWGGGIRVKILACVLFEIRVRFQTCLGQEEREGRVENHASETVNVSGDAFFFLYD